MQTQPAEAFCFQINMGAVKLVSMPSDHVPKRVDWAKWIDCSTAELTALRQQMSLAPRICMSPDHTEPKDNLGVVSIHGQRGLEHVDPMKLLADVSENIRYLFVGSWNHPIPSWSASVQAIHDARYGGLFPEFLSSQIKHWQKISETLDVASNFLVTDDVGRLSALSGLSRAWLGRQLRSGVFNEPKSASWVACSIDLYTPLSAGGTSIKLHRAAVLDPESWCSSPRLCTKHQELLQLAPECPELWVSSPGIGLSMWLAEQRAPLKNLIERLRCPSAVLGWHPLRDALAFLGAAPNGSVMILVDRHSRLQILLKEDGDQS
jgi:hypothetical protein